MADQLLEINSYIEALEKEPARFDEAIQKITRDNAARTVKFYTKNGLFEPIKDKAAIEQVLYLFGMLTADKYTRHERRKLAADLRSAAVDNNAVGGDTEEKTI